MRLLERLKYKFLIKDVSTPVPLGVQKTLQRATEKPATNRSEISKIFQAELENPTAGGPERE